MITDLDSDGDGEVSKKELKNVFAKLFPGANFEATWEVTPTPTPTPTPTLTPTLTLIPTLTLTGARLGRQR